MAQTVSGWRACLAKGALAPHYYHGRGCQSCNFTGYSGRLGVFEMLEPDERMMDALRGNDPESFARAASSIPRLSAVGCDGPGLRQPGDGARLYVKDVIPVTVECQ